MFVRLNRLLKAAWRRTLLLIQRATRLGFDVQLAERIEETASRLLAHESQRSGRYVPVVRLHTLDLSDRQRFSIARDDIYRRFEVDEGGQEKDKFGRKGRWIPRGCMVYFDTQEADYIKVVDPYFCQQGEGRFLRDVLEAGVYDELCPNLSYLIEDDDKRLRGYAIAEGEPITPYQFERYLSGGYGELVKRATKASGFYFNDLEYHNVVRNDAQLSLIDLESVLPISWFETDLEFARQHLGEVDIGWPIQAKWEAPKWYGEFVRTLRDDSSE